MSKPKKIKKTSEEMSIKKNEHTDYTPVIKSPGREKDKQETDCRLRQAGEEALEQLEKSYLAVSELSDKRQAYKLSNSRVSAIARELKELIKVLSMYAI